MKSFITAALLAMSFHSFYASANQEHAGVNKQIVCGEAGSANKIFSAPFVDFGDFVEIAEAGFAYKFAASNLVCTGYELENLGCLGYWNGIPGPVAELRTSKDQNGNIVAKIYVEPYRQHLALNCEVLDQ